MEGYVRILLGFDSVLGVVSDSGPARVATRWVEISGRWWKTMRVFL